MRHWGKHCLANALACNRQIITNPRRLELFSQELVKKIDMIAYGPCRLAHFGLGNKSGWTMVQLIETSNITGHFCDESGDAYIDVFSCKDFDEAVVRAVIMDCLKPTMLDCKVVYRDAGARME